MTDPRKAPRQRTKKPTESPLQQRRTLERKFDRVRALFFDGKISFEKAERRLEAINRKLDKLPQGRPSLISPTDAAIGTAIGATAGLIGVGVLANIAADI